ncbi:MAG: FMN-binding protein [Gammaproteobacteria bacterium]|jgi:hypothetical protein
MESRVIAFLGLLLPAGALPAGTYLSPEAFLDEVFAGSPPPAQVLWLQGDTGETAAEILGHRYPALRLRYWERDARSAWIVEEIGKEKPITVGLVVNARGLETIRVLAFRESRGWEVRHPFFTDQFTGIGLTDDHRLNRHIDGISGATLSVRALKKLARLALYLHTRITPSRDTPP